MPCPIRSKDECFAIANEALHLWYNIRIKNCETVDDAAREINNFSQVKKYIKDAFDKLEC